MSTKVDGPPGVSSGFRWTVGRVATDLAIIMVAVPLVLVSLDPETGGGGCGMTGVEIFLPLGLLILGVRATWIFGKAVNDAGERWLRLPNPPIPRCKPQPLDDF